MAHDESDRLSELPAEGALPTAWEFPPPAATVRVAFGAQSRRGSSHAVNEDHYAIIELGRHEQVLFTSLPETGASRRFDEFGYAMIVADSFGGDVAGRVAITSLLHLLLHFGKWNLRVDELIAREIMDRANRFYRIADSAVVRHGLATLPRPQTTLTAIFGAGRDLFIGHVGHSRGYLCRDGVLMALTRDHTLNAKRPTHAAAAPLINVKLAARDGQHILTEALGMPEPSGPAIALHRFQVLDDDRVLVCTNGLTDAVDESDITRILSSTRPPDEQSRMLIEAASTTDDDVTALVARYRVP
jgi:serine/threonine protein phosphatase PrpC